MFSDYCMVSDVRQGGTQAKNFFFLFHSTLTLLFYKISKGSVRQTKFAWEIQRIPQSIRQSDYKWSVWRQYSTRHSNDEKTISHLAQTTRWMCATTRLFGFSSLFTCKTRICRFCATDSPAGSTIWGTIWVVCLLAECKHNIRFLVLYQAKASCRQYQTHQVVSLISRFSKFATHLDTSKSFAFQQWSLRSKGTA